MKKFTFLLAAMLLACTTGLFATETTWEWTATNNALGTSTPASVTLNEKAWTVTRSSAQYTGFISSYIQLGKNGGAESVTLTSSAFEGTIKSVVVNCASYNGAHTIGIKVGESEYYETKETPKWSNNAGGDVTGTGTAAGDITITFTAGSSARALYIKSITVVTEQVVDENTVATPTFIVTGTEVGGSYITSADVQITCATDGAAISYSTDNGATWNAYSTALTITETTTLQAKATKEEMTESGVATKNITIIPSIANTQATALTTAEAISLIENTLAEQLAAEVVYVKGTVSKVDKYDDTYKSITYWLDEDAFQIYSGKGLNKADFASINEVLVGAEVVVCGNLKKFVTSSATTYELDYDNYLVAYTAPADAKEIATLTLNGNKTAMEIGEADNEYTVTYDGDGELTITSSDETVAEAIIVDKDVIVSAVAEGTTTITISAPETDNYYAVKQQYTLTVSPAWVAASLPFAFNEGKSSISVANGIKQSGLGTDYSAAPKLKFDDTGDELVIKIKDAATNVSYDIKGNAFSGGTFEVKESADDQAYTTVAAHTALTTTTQNETKSLASTTRYVKFVYTQKSTGNVALGNIKIYDSTTTINESATIAEKAVKMIEDGQLVIVREGVKYNAQGVKVE